MFNLTHLCFCQKWNTSFCFPGSFRCWAHHTSEVCQCLRHRLEPDSTISEFTILASSSEHENRQHLSSKKNLHYNTRKLYETLIAMLFKLYGQSLMSIMPYQLKLKSYSCFLVKESQPCSLRSKGLCLVPASYTVGVVSSNGADIWAPIKTSQKF